MHGGDGRVRKPGMWGHVCVCVCVQRGRCIEGLFVGGVYPRTAESLKVPVCVWELHVYEKM